MTRRVALLRGINVGGHRIKMDALRGHFEDMGFADVSTFIASGNVLFTAPGKAAALEREIEKSLAAALGYEVPTFLRTPDELAAVTAFDPGGDVEAIYVGFMVEPAGRELRDALTALASEYDAFRFDGREFYWLLQGKLSESPLFGGRFEKAVRGVPHTMRKMTSVQKLAAKAAKE